MKLLPIALVLCSTLFFSQTIAEIDSVSKKLCTEIESSDESLGSEKRIQQSFEKVAFAFTDQFDENLREEINERIFYRLQRIGCLKFLELYTTLTPESGSMKRTNKMPNSDISAEQLKNFKKLSEFYYTENNGTTTKVQLSKIAWISTYSDEDFSKYNLKWKNSSEFEIDFVESTRGAIKKMNMIGDKYYYKIINYDKIDNFYTLVEYIPNTFKFAEFRLYIIK